MSEPRKFVSISMVVVHGTHEGRLRLNGFAYLAIADDGTAWEGWQPEDSMEFTGWTQTPALPVRPEASK